MNTIKLVVTHKGRLAKKYGAKGLARIDKAVAASITSDAKRAIETHYVHLDDEAEMQKLGVTAMKGKVTPERCKNLIDKLHARLAPGYLVLLGSNDVIPHFSVDNPSYHEGGDTDLEVPTDNPYACSRPYSKSDRKSYLISDRVIGRVPDLPESDDPAWLTDYLNVAASWKMTIADDYAEDLCVCCDVWKESAKSCLAYMSREKSKLFISPPTLHGSQPLLKRHKARLHLIKCHGVPLGASFYGQNGNDYPEVLNSASLLNRTIHGTVVGAMCCYGAALFNPDDPASVSPGAPPIPSVYLRQGAYGYVGATTIAWVGLTAMLCADWIVTSYLRDVLRGASLGRALLDSKQNLVKWINQQGRTPDLAEEKTLLQFLLLGDPSIHTVSNVQASDAAVIAGLPKSIIKSSPIIAFGASDERRARRAFQHETGKQQRTSLPERNVIEKTSTVAAKAFDQVAKSMGDYDFSRPIACEVRRPPTTSGLAMAGMPNLAKGLNGNGNKSASEERFEYYWVGRKQTNRVIDARMVKIETDKSGNLIRTQTLVST